PYGKMLGAAPIGYQGNQKGSLIAIDRSFPGMEGVDPQIALEDFWYASKLFASDLHVIWALDGSKMKGNLYQRGAFPVAWARQEGKGRVFYTSMGGKKETWTHESFQKMLMGAIRWTTGLAQADITPNLQKVTPKANEIPSSALKPLL
ncbi:MAG: ThuA domain-containing protein, partial [Verrucomicrobiota bacterium]